MRGYGSIHYAFYLEPTDLREVKECNYENLDKKFTSDRLDFKADNNNKLYLTIFAGENDMYRMVYTNNGTKIVTLSDPITYNTMLNYFRNKKYNDFAVSILGKNFKVTETYEKVNEHIMQVRNDSLKNKVAKRKANSGVTDYSFPKRFESKIIKCSLEKDIKFYDRDYDPDINNYKEFIRTHEQPSHANKTYRELVSTKREISRRYNIIKEQLERKTLDQYKKINLKTKSLPEEGSLTKALIKTYATEDSLEDYNHFQSLWNNPRFGPIIATLIYTGSFQRKIPMRALENTWDKMRLDIIELSKKLPGKEPLFVRIYRKLVTKTYKCYYSSEQYNFLIDFYERGACNCECGSLLGFVLANMFPEKRYIVMAKTIHRHIFLVYYDKPNQQFYQFETTEVLKFTKPISIQNVLENMLCLITSEQVMAIKIIVSSSRRYGFSKILEERMFGFDYETSTKNEIVDKIFDLVNTFKNLCKTCADIYAIYVILTSRINGDKPNLLIMRRYCLTYVSVQHELTDELKLEINTELRDYYKKSKAEAIEERKV